MWPVTAADHGHTGLASVMNCCCKYEMTFSQARARRCVKAMEEVRYADLEHTTIF